MTYASINFKTKKAFREAVERGEVITLYEPGLGRAPTEGRACVEGPWYPEPHRWYAGVEVSKGRVVKVR